MRHVLLAAVAGAVVLLAVPDASATHELGHLPGAGPLLLELGEPAVPLRTAMDVIAVNGRAADGSLVRVYEDRDGDGAADGAPVATQQLSPETRLFELRIPVTLGETGFVLQATRQDEQSLPVSTPRVVREALVVEPPELLSGELQVRLASSDDFESKMRDVEQRLRQSGADPRVERFFDSTHDVLARWLYVRVADGTENRAVAALEQHPAVDIVERIPLREFDYEPNDPFFPNGWHLEQIGAIDGWDIERSRAGVRVAIIDSQFEETHPDLDDKFDFVNRSFGGNCGNVAQASHGTQTAGSAAAETDNTTGVAAVGFDSHLIGYAIGQEELRDGVMTCVPEGDWAGALVHAADNGADVVNMSFSGLGASAAERDAVRYASNRGVTLVASAGNTSANTTRFPASLPEVIGVVATDDTDTRSTFSNFGPTVSIAAPGEGIWTTTTGGAYTTVNGTSFAAPVTAGAASLVRDHWNAPGLRTRHRLEDAADEVAAYPGDVNEDVGNGRLNVLRALTERVVRLAGTFRQNTAAEIAREAAPRAETGQGHVVDTLVLVNADEPEGWVDTLAAGPLLNRYETVFVLTQSSVLDEVARVEINRLFGVDDTEVDASKTVLIAGGPGGSISASVEGQLDARFTVRRIAGATRYATAAAIADDVTTGVSQTQAIVTRGDIYADALAMSGVAARFGYPMVFVHTGVNVPTETCSWLTRHPEIRTLHLAGGTAAIRPEVASRLATSCGASESSPRTILREAGVDRFDTSAEIAQVHFPEPDGFVVAYGYGWPDAIAASGLSRAYNAPILLSDFHTLHPVLRPYVAAARAQQSTIDEAWVLGGSMTTISADAEDELEMLMQQ